MRVAKGAGQDVWYHSRERIDRMHRLITIMLIALVLVVGAAIGVRGRVWLDGQSSTAAVPTTPPTSAPAAVVAPTAPQAVTATPNTRDTVIEVTESELQARLDSMLIGRSLGSTPMGDATIQSATVALRDRQIVVSGTARAGVLNAPFTAAGTVTPDGNGRPLARVDEATVGGVVVPEAARSALAGSLQTQMDALFVERAIKVRSIEIADGKMRVVGTAGS